MGHNNHHSHIAYSSTYIEAIFPSRFRFFAFLAVSVFVGLSLFLTACKSTPPPPPEPEKAEVASAPEAPPSPPLLFVTVIGSKLNVREGPDTKKPTLAKVNRGAKLQIVSEQGEWFQVKLPDEKIGWVAAKYVTKGEPCLGDKATAELLNAPPLSFIESDVHGKIVIDATVNSAGVVISTKTVQNTTGIVEFEKKAIEEIKQLKFAPPIKRCKPVSFIYSYSRTY